MHALDLPEPIAAYFKADGSDGLAVARCFTRTGQVLDEGETHTGHAAIAAWKTAASARYTYSAQPRAVERDGQRYRVTSHVSGDFPGSPVDLRYSFELARGKIATLEIGA